jgi:hypothetical protein
MPGFLATINSTVTCTHMGKAAPMTPNPRVKVMGQPVPVIAAPVMITACPFQMPTPQSLGVPVPCPCISGNWLPPSGTARVKSMGQPLVCPSSQGMVMVTMPPAPPNPFHVMISGQTKVKAM